MCKRRASALCFVLSLLVIASNVYAEIVVYDFSAPQFLLGQNTPFSAVAPNIGPSTFLADFSANTSSYVISVGYWPLFSGQALLSQCFGCAQTMTITFNTPVYAVSVNFASIVSGFTLNLTSAVGTTSASYGPTGGTINFSSETPFTWIQLGTGIFAVDNLTLNTEGPRPQHAVERPLKIDGHITLTVNLTTGNSTMMDWGEATHTGRFENQGTGHLNLTTGALTGSGTFTAANGDQVFWVEEDNEIVVTGGTGRFEGITGGFRMAPTSDVVTTFPDANTMIMTYTYEGVGTITY